MSRTRESGWHTVHETGGSLGYSTIFFISIAMKVFMIVNTMVWGVVAVDKTSESTDIHSTRYIARNRLGDNFTIRAEEDRSWKVFAFVFTYCFTFSILLLWYCVPVSVVLSSVGTAFPMEFWWHHYVLCFVRTTTVPGCWRMYAVPAVSSSVCVLHIKPFF